MNAKSYTKAELIEIIKHQNAEIAGLRLMVSELTLTAEMNKAPEGEPAELSEQEHPEAERAHTYANFVAAKLNCLRLRATHGAKWIFTQVGNTVTAKARTA